MPNYQIRADVFPATTTITAPDGTATTYDKTRVVLTLDHVYVFQDGPDTPLLFEDRLTSYTPPIPPTRVRSASQLNNRYATFETEDGYSAQFLRAGGCGCGSNLKTAKLSALIPEISTTQVASTNDSV